MSSRSWLAGSADSNRVGGADSWRPPNAAGGAVYAEPSGGRAMGHGSSSAGAASAGTDDWIFAGRADRIREHERAVEEPGLEGGKQAGAASAASPPVASFASLRILGQLRASYLLAESERGLIVVDQHAAHERILYEGLRSDWLESGVLGQGLLAPVSVPLPPASIAALSAASQVVERLGFEIEDFGEGNVLVRSIPAEMAGQDVATLVTELGAALEETEGEVQADASAIRWLPSLDRLFATLACHAARRFGDRLPSEEQRAILSGLDTIPWAPTCPHGRPVAILIDHADLEARFRRR